MNVEPMANSDAPRVIRGPRRLKVAEATHDAGRLRTTVQLMDRMEMSGKDDNDEVIRMEALTRNLTATTKSGTTFPPGIAEAQLPAMKRKIPAGCATADDC